MRLLQGKNVIITGARRGIGRATLDLFAAHGANIWACARQPDRAFEEHIEKIENQYNVWIKPIYFDLQRQEEIVAAVQKIRECRSTIDVLCNIAGANSPYRRFQMIPLADYKSLFESNFFGPVFLTQHVSRVMMMQHKGSIIYVSSIAGSDGFFASCDYVATKAAVMGATRQQARELGEFGIRVNHVSPGVIETEMLNYENRDALDSILPAIALKRFGKANEIADVMLFLASDLASYITGQEIRVDGGTTSPRATW